jgi:hypothetical protein
MNMILNTHTHTHRKEQEMIECSAPRTIAMAVLSSRPSEKEGWNINWEEERLGRELGFEHTTACVLTSNRSRLLSDPAPEVSAEVSLGGREA